MGALIYVHSFSSQRKVMVAAPHHHRPRANMPTAFPTALQTAPNSPNMPFAALFSTYPQSNVPTGRPILGNYGGQYQPQIHISAPPGFTNNSNLSIPDQKRNETTPANLTPFKIQFRQNGALHSIDIPLSCPVSQREIEQLQEYAQNSNFGITNILGSAKCILNSSLQSYHANHTRFHRIRGGLFDGLTRDEAAWLEEVAWKTCLEWKGEKFSDEEVEFLYQAGLPGARVFPTACSVKYKPAHYELEDDALDNIEARFTRL